MASKGTMDLQKLVERLTERYDHFSSLVSLSQAAQVAAISSVLWVSTSAVQ